MPSSAKSTDRYLMEGPEEAQRLEAKTDAVLSERLLRQVGLSAGMRVLDAGAGTGAVARVMSEIVGPTGSVAAFDGSGARLEFGRLRSKELGIDNLDFIEGDLTAGPPAGGPYDLVWSRFVFEYLRDPDLVLDHLVRSTRIGGTVVVGDLDGNGTFHYPCPPEIEDGLNRVLAALEGRFDPYAGRKLYSRFRKRGLENVRVHAEPYHLYAGAASAGAVANWEQKLVTIRPLAVRALGGEAEYERWARGFMDLLNDPNVFTYSMLLLVQGTRAQ